ncbi:MAG: class I SAM-dependent methyltransferase [Gemmatimonadota bacterium]
MTRSSESAPRDWFRAWFGDEYLAIYPHRDVQEARRAVRLYLDRAPPPAGSVLDLACGAGRHLRELLAAGVHAAGLDLSITMLERARRESPKAQLVRGDMRRLPFEDRSFAGLTSFFTSFGYFATGEQDRVAAAEMHRVMRPGGSFMLDFLNADRVRRELVPSESGRIRGYDVSVAREIQEDTVVKTITLNADEGDEVRRYEERVRLYEADQLARLLRDVGLQTRHRFGDYDGAAFDSSSARLILAGVAA